MKFGQNFTKAAIEWPENTTVSIHGDRLMCQETLVLIDVGAWSELEGHTSIAGQAQPCPGFHFLQLCSAPLKSWISCLCVLFC